MIRASITVWLIPWKHKISITNLVWNDIGDCLALYIMIITQKTCIRINILQENLHKNDFYVRLEFHRSILLLLLIWHYVMYIYVIGSSRKTKIKTIKSWWNTTLIFVHFPILIISCQTYLFSLCVPFNFQRQSYFHLNKRFWNETTKKKPNECDSIRFVEIEVESNP